MPSMPYGSVQMPIGWNGLSMSTEECSVCMPIVIINFKGRVLNRTQSHVCIKIVLTHISIKCGIVDPNVYRFLDSFG